MPRFDNEAADSPASRRGSASLLSHAPPPPPSVPHAALPRGKAVAPARGIGWMVKSEEAGAQTARTKKAMHLEFGKTSTPSFDLGTSTVSR